MTSNSQSGRSARGQGHLLRQRILDVAAALLDAVDDASEISTREIARHVDKTVPALYQHFPDKATLLTAAALHALDAMGTEVSTLLHGEEDLDVRLRARAESYVQFAIDHGAAYRLLFMSSPTTPGRPDSLAAIMSTTGFHDMAADVAAAQVAGLMTTDTNAERIALNLWTAVHGVASLVISHPALDWPDRFLDGVLDQHALGLIPR